MQTIHARNVNGAFDEMVWLATEEHQARYWRSIAPRGQRTLELIEPMATCYSNPMERVLFHPQRDANPFFHFFEALWILAGRNDVAFLKQFNSNIASYSDDGAFFHGAYGFRLRKHFEGFNSVECEYYAIDQISTVIEKLRADHTTRQAVLCIWDPGEDLNYKGKDTPCNDLIFLKVRDEKLEMRVCCRSNDAIWGAYGANVVQFSTLQEFIAGAVGVGVGPYTQISDSFHIYTDREDWARIKTSPRNPIDPYETSAVSPYSLFKGCDASAYWAWLDGLTRIFTFTYPSATNIPCTYFSNIPYLNDVAWPMYRAWRCWKSEMGTKNSRIANAAYMLDEYCLARDWALAGKRWLERRKEEE